MKSQVWIAREKIVIRLVELNKIISINRINTFSNSYFGKKILKRPIIPPISISELNSLFISCKDYLSIIKGISFSFPFDLSNFFLSDFKSNPENCEIYSFLLMNLYFLAYLEIEERKNPKIMNRLISTMSNQYFSAHNDIVLLELTDMFQTIAPYFSSDIVIRYRNFVYMNNCFPLECLSMVVDTFGKVVGIHKFEEGSITCFYYPILVHILMNSKDVFDITHITQLYTSISPYVLSFNEHAIVFFHSIIHHIPNPFIRGIFEDIISVFLTKCFESKNNDDFVEKCQPYHINEMISSFSYIFSEKSTFENGFDIPKKEFESMPLDHFFTKSQSEDIRMICKLIAFDRSLTELFLCIMYKYITRITDYKQKYMLSVFLSIVPRVNSVNLEIDPIESIFSAELLSKNQSSYLLYSLRESYTFLLLKYRSDYVIQLFNDSVCYPELFFELNHILLFSSPIKEKIFSMIDNKWFRMFQNTSGILQGHAFKGDTNASLECARKNQIYFFVEMINNRSIYESIKTDKKFLIHIFTFFLEDPPRKILLSSLSENVNDYQVSEHLTTIIQINSSHIVKRSYSLLIDIIDEILIIKPETPHCCFSGYFKILIPFINAVDTIHESKQFLIKIIRAFPYLDDDDRDLQIMESSLKKFPKELDDLYICAALIYKLDVFNNQYSGLIKCPYAVKLIVRLYIDQYANEVCEILDRILNNSYKNLISLHECQVDLELITFISDKANSIEPNIFSRILSIIMSMILYVSSPTTIQPIFGMLIQNDFRDFPPYFQTILQSIIALFEEGRNTPSFFSTMNVRQSQKFNSANNGVRVIVWVEIPSSFSSLIRFEKHQKTIFHLCISKDGVLLNSNNIKYSFCEKKWYCICLNIKSDSSLSIYVDCKNIHEDKSFEFCEKEFNIILGGAINLNGKIGPFIIEEQIPRLEYYDIYNAGPNRICESECPKSIRFPDVFLVAFGAEITIPLFSYFSFNFEHPDYIEEVFTLFKSVLLFSSKGKNSFHELSGFEILSHIISTFSSEMLTIDLFIMFYELLRDLNHDELNHSLCKNIVFNFFIWRKANATTTTTIIAYYANVIYKEFPHYLKQYITFEQLFIEDHFIFNENYHPLISDIRSQMMKLATLLFDEINLSANLNVLIGAICSANTDVQEYYLQCLFDLQQKYDSVKNILTIQPSFLHSLSCIVSDSSSKSILFVLKIVTDSQRNPEKNNLHWSIINRIIEREPKIDICTELFHNINEGKYDLFPLFCFMLMQSGDISRLFQLIPSESFSIMKFWDIPSIIMVLCSSLSISDKLFDFLIDCTPLKWKEFYDHLEICSKILNVRCIEYTTNLLIRFANTLLKEECMQNQADEFYILAQRHIFMQPSYFYYNNIINEMKTTYKDTIEIREISNKPPSNASKVFLDSLKNPSLSIQFCVGIRVSEQNELSDSDLGVLCLEVFKKFPSIKFLGFVMILSGFLIKDRYVVVIKWIQSMNEILNDSEDYTRFNPFISYCIKKYKSHGQNNESFDPNQVNSIIENFFEEQLMNRPTISDEIESIVCQIHNPNMINNYNQIFIKFREDYSLVVREMKSSFESQKEKCDKLWKHFWTNSSSDGSPWGVIKQDNASKYKWKRDSTLNCFLIPSKLKNIKHFDSHIKASIARDTGSYHTAEQQVALLKKNLEEKYSQEGFPKLLETIEDKMIYRNNEIENTKKVLNEYSCQLKKISGTYDSKLFIYPKFIEIIVKEKKSHIIYYHEITHVLHRRICHFPIAFEIFTNDGRSFLLSFSIDADKIISEMNIHKKNTSTIILKYHDFRHQFELMGFTEKWRNQKISNFEYLIALNLYSGRSFNDPSSYPVFPWILSEYQSSRISFQKEFFRDLSKPIGAISADRLNDLKYRMIEAGDPNNFYLYSSYVSCPLSVFMYLIRIEPFTNQHVEIQGGKFDHPARIFSSIGDSYRLVTTFLNDYRELVPEFFFLPEFLTNLNNYDLGVAKGREVGSVTLPPWAKNAFDFVYIHRKALESEYVSTQINKWIDLIWGYKTRGSMAKECDNLYLKSMYDDIWTDSNLKDPHKRAEIESILTHVGQIPSQLFTEPHPSRLFNNTSPPSILKKIDIKSHESIISSSISIIGENVQVIVLYLTMIRILIFSKSQFDLCEDLYHTIDESVGYFDVFSYQYRSVFLFSKSGVFESNFSGIPRQLDTSIGNCSFSNNILAYSSEKTRVVISGPNFKYSIPFYGEGIECVAVSDSFRSLVIGTKSGRVIVCALYKGTKEHSFFIPKPFIPVDISISPSWGFIVVYAQSVNNGNHDYCFFIYTINGQEINSIKLDNPIPKFCTAKSNSCFDYIIASQEKGKFIFYEAYQTNISKIDPIRNEDKSETLSFAYVENQIISIHKNGTLRIIPMFLK